MVRRVLLLAGILLFYAEEQVFAGTESSQKQTSYSWPPDAETQTVEAEHTYSGAAAILNNGLVTWEQSTNQTAENAKKVNGEITSNKHGLGLLTKIPRFPVSVQKLSVFFAVLLCLGLFTAALRTRAAPIEPDEGRIREIEARLEKVKALLPAAETLALVVDSAESHELLKTFREIVAEKDIAAEGARDASTLEASLANALDTLRRLHQAGLGEADAIVQADRSLPQLSTLGFPPMAAEAALVNLEKRAEEETVRPLIRTYRSLLENDTLLAERLQALAKHFSSQRLFENEEDGEMLLSTASAFEVLLATSASRKRLAKFGQEIGSAAFEGIRLTFIEYHEHAFLDIEKDLQILQLSLALRRNAADAGGGSAAALLSGADAEKASLDAMEEDMREVEALLPKLRSDAEKLWASTSLADAAAAGESLLVAEQQARAFLIRCAQTESSLPNLPSSLDDESLLMALQMGASNAAFVQNACEHVTQSLQRLRERLKIAWEEPPSFDALSQDLAKNLLRTAKSTALEAEKRTRQADARLQNLRKGKDVRAALKELTETSYCGLLQVLDTRSLNVLELDAELVMFLEDDVSHIIAQAGRVASWALRLSARETREYKGLLKQLDAARRGAKKAQSLLEAADAAADMRSCLFSMQRLLLSSSEGDRS